MESGGSGLLRRYPVPIGYVAVLAVVSAVYAHVMSGVDQRSFVSWASTNLANLASRPVPALVVSAFLSVDPIIVWAVLTTVGLVLLVRRFGNLRAAILVAAAHVAGTLVSEGIVAWRLAADAAPTALRHISDVGPSYVTVSALTAAAVFGRVRWQRVVALAGWLVLAPFLFEGIAAFDVAAVGHAVSILVGVLLGALFRRDRRGMSLATSTKARPPTVGAGDVALNAAQYTFAPPGPGQPVGNGRPRGRRELKETPMNDDDRRDVTQVLIHDHREVQEMFAQLEKGDIGDARNIEAVVERVTVELVRHASAEERHLYPAVRLHVAGGDALADAGIREHAEAEELMKALDHLEPSDDAFGRTLARLMTGVRAHIAEEEDVLFPKLIAACTREQLLDLGDQIAAAKKTAPTRPHPAAPHTPPANVVTAPLLGLVDKARDVLSHRATDQ